MPGFPFTAIVGMDDMALSLILSSISPDIGGVLVRGEKGTAKSTMVRALVELLPSQDVVDGCRFHCDPSSPDPICPDGPHPVGAAHHTTQARLVELPVGASEDRVIGSLDLEKALSQGETQYQPGLLAAANRGILYVDEVNLLHDHLVDLLLDAAAMGRATVEREGVSVSHAARIVLVGTMNPEEGELRPQLLDRFGLTVEVSAPREPQQRVEVVRRRMAYDADPAGFVAEYAAQQAEASRRLIAARSRLGDVTLSDWSLAKIAEICAAFDVDGMRADIVTARAAIANAAWEGRSRVTKADIRVAAKLALPHRRRRKPFDAPDLDEDLLDALLDEDDPDDDPEPPEDPEPPNPPDEDEHDPENHNEPEPQQPDQQEPETPPMPPPHEPEQESQETPPQSLAPTGLTSADKPFRPKTFRVTGVGEGEPGKRSKSITRTGRVLRPTDTAEASGQVHLMGTMRVAAPHQRARGRASGQRLRLAPSDVRRTIAEGRESNLIVFAVDASGSMAARRRMASVKTAILSLLLDAYQRRDKVALVCFRADEARLELPATNSIEAAATRLDDLPHGGRTPLAEGLWRAHETIRIERIKDPKRRPLLFVITDGRATSGANALARARRAADEIGHEGVGTVVIDCESGRMRLGLARELAVRMGADCYQLEEISADAIVGLVNHYANANDSESRSA